MKPLNKNNIKQIKKEDNIKELCLKKEWEFIINYKYNDKVELVNKKTLKNEKK